MLFRSQGSKKAHKNNNQKRLVREDIGMKRKLTVGIAALTNDFSLKGNRTYGEELVPEYLIHILDLSSFQHFEYFKTELEPFFSLYQKRNRKKFVEY